ncbi:MAG: hypothetical protein ISS23_03010 [Nanoarchaeota archaeon]|nr:hypothetical protein [Nanoarchaeota archaeon]
MKKYVFISLFFFTIFIIPILAQQAELRIRFHSFGKNATIDLKEYLGESEQYLISPTENVIVRINQGKGTAILTARPGWDGVETILFRTKESTLKLNETEETGEKETEEKEIKEPLHVVTEIIDLGEIRDDGLTSLFQETIDPSILDIIKKVKREEIKNLSSEIEVNTVKISINEEVDLKIGLGYVPTISMDFSLKGKGTEGIEPEKESIIPRIKNIISIILLSILAIIGGYFYIEYSKKKEEKRKVTELEGTTSKDTKQLTLYKLRKLQRGIGKKNADEFMTILREFFSHYFGIEYNFEFKSLARSVQNSDISDNMKDEIIDFLNNVSEIQGKLSKSDRKLITKMKRIIRHL